MKSVESVEGRRRAQNCKTGERPLCMRSSADKGTRGRICDGGCLERRAHSRTLERVRGAKLRVDVETRQRGRYTKRLEEFVK